MDIQEKIKSKRTELNLSLEQVGNYVGVSKATVMRWESGEIGSMKLDKVSKLAELFKVSPHWLIGWGDNAIEDVAVAEQTLLTHFNHLNESGQDNVIDYTKNLVHVPGFKLDPNQKPKPKPKDSTINFPERTYEEIETTDIKVFNQKASAGLGNYLSDTSDDEYEVLDLDSKDVPKGADFAIRISGNSMEPKIKDGEIVFIRPTITVDYGHIGVFVVDDEALCKVIVKEGDTVAFRSLNKDYEDIILTEEMVVRTVGEVLK